MAAVRVIFHSAEKNDRLKPGWVRLTDESLLPCKTTLLMVIINEWDTSETSTRNISNWFEEWTGAQKRKYWSITQLILIQCLFLRVPSTMPYIMWKNKVAVREVPKVSMFCEVSLQGCFVLWSKRVDIPSGPNANVRDEVSCSLDWNWN